MCTAPGALQRQELSFPVPAALLRVLSSGSGVGAAFAQMEDVLGSTPPATIPPAPCVPAWCQRGMSHSQPVSPLYSASQRHSGSVP